MRRLAQNASNSCRDRIASARRFASPAAGIPAARAQPLVSVTKALEELFAALNPLLTVPLAGGHRLLEDQPEPSASEREGANWGPTPKLAGPQVTEKMERANGFEPSTCTLARYRSTN